jgi:hypothetical protein
MKSLKKNRTLLPNRAGPLAKSSPSQEKAKAGAKTMTGGAGNVGASITRHDKWARIVVIATLAAASCSRQRGKGVDARNDD